MTTARLKTLVIENFRVLRGKVAIPLDAQVVLIHGSNGMGKTSVLSALELALTGRISHLAANGVGYRRYLTTLETDRGSIELTTTGAYKPGASVAGSLAFSDTTFKPAALLDATDADFFSERCYLPQATLGRLLEIYDDQQTSTTSPLTLFVKELLGIDPLDALVDGLYAAYHVTRVRNLVPAYRRLETLQASLKREASTNERTISSVKETSARRLASLNATLAQIPSESPLVIDAATKLDDLRVDLEGTRDKDRVLIDLNLVRSELKASTEQWQSLPADDLAHDHAGKERAEQSAAKELSAWREEKGHALEAVLTELEASFPDLPSINDGPEEARSAALGRAIEEVRRCETVLANAKTHADRRSHLETIIQRATARIGELDHALAVGPEDARSKSLANALAGVAAHVAGETCPVCDRNFRELDSESLSTHITAKIASLIGEADRLQSLANERASESNNLSMAQNELPNAGFQLSPEHQASLTVQRSQMASAVQRLKALWRHAAQGSELVANFAAARDAVKLARRRDELSTSILPQIDAIVAKITARQVNSFDGVTTALAEAERVLDERITAAETAATLRILALSELELYAGDLDQITELKAASADIAARLASVKKADSEVSRCRTHSKEIGNSAKKVRSEIVKTVFSTSLNTVWRDLFVRLAPSEQFVPAFKLPGDDGKVEAILETLHRSGKTSGAPGAMLSHGNLNTAALTLFLALYLSVPWRMPWLVLDDPVQSMDDVHIAQFAALLRTLCKRMGRQLIVAVHERALFDYLTLELSPAFPGDSLISVEITRHFNGDSVATPQAFSYEEDRAVAV